MKGLTTLVRLHKWRIDESTRSLADLDALAARFRREIDDIDIRLAAEAPLAGDSVESATSYSNFMRVETARRTTLEQSLIDLDCEVIQAREQLAAAFRELKTYEITLSHKREHAARMNDRRQQSILDEMGQVLHRARATENFS